MNRVCDRQVSQDAHPMRTERSWIISRDVLLRTERRKLGSLSRQHRPQSILSGLPHQRGKHRVAICYDRHFEGVVHSLKEGGAELVFCPAITFGKKSQKVWHQEFSSTRFATESSSEDRIGWVRNRHGRSSISGKVTSVDRRESLPEISAGPGLVMADVDLSELSGARSIGMESAARHSLRHLFTASAASERHSVTPAEPTNW